MGHKREPSAETAALVAELRQIEVDWRAVGEVDRAAFRELWTAKLAGDLTPPPQPPVVCTIWLGYMDPAEAIR